MRTHFPISAGCSFVIFWVRGDQTRPVSACKISTNQYHGFLSAFLQLRHGVSCREARLAAGGAWCCRGCMVLQGVQGAAGGAWCYRRCTVLQGDSVCCRGCMCYRGCPVLQGSAGFCRGCMVHQGRYKVLQGERGAIARALYGVPRGSRGFQGLNSVAGSPY